MPPLPRNIILAGFMGTGKSSVGRKLAERLGWAFVDADDCIEAKAGKPIARIFAEEGEPAFRAIESEVARELACGEKQVVATGGGMVVNPSNRRTLESAGALILLQASAEAIWERVKHEKHRPLLSVPDPQGRIRELLASRREAYGTIALKIETENKTIESIVDEILSLPILGA